MFMQSIAAGAAAMLALGAAHAPVAAARTDDARVVCDGGSLIGDFEPGLSAVSANISITGHGDLTGCRGADITGGRFTLTGSGSGSCLKGWDGQGDLKVVWHKADGKQESSTLAWHGNAGTRPDIFNGTVTSGLDTGGNGHLEAQTVDVTLDSVAQCVVGITGAFGYKQCHAKITYASLEAPPARR